MTDPCNKGPDIDKLNHKVDNLIEAQRATSADLKEAINRLASIVEADIETRAAVEQLKKDREILYAKYHGIDARTDAIEIRNARCDGAGIFENFPTVWNYIQQEKGWRRFLPGVMTFLSFLLLLFSTLSDKVVLTYDHPELKKDPRGSVKRDVGIDFNERH